MRSQKYVENLFENGKCFCVLPWIHLHVNGYGYMPRCALVLEGPDSKGYGSLNTNTFYELWQGEAIRKLRLKMLADERDEQCANCYEYDKVNQYSIRRNTNRLFQKYLPWVMDTDDMGYAPQAKPIYWDIRFSNLCNLSCRVCNFSSSSSWYKDAIALGKLDSNTTHAVVYGLKDSAAFLNELKPYYPEVAQIYFAGGEPLLFNENLAMLEDLNSMNRHEVELRYNTNFTHIHPRYPTLWKKYPKLSLSISLDGSGGRGEFLRKGLIWDEFLGNLDRIKKECPNADINFNFTVNVYNILHLPDFHREMFEKGHIKANQIYLNMLHNPECYNVRVLPEELKRQATHKLTEHIFWLTQDPGASIYVNDNQSFMSQWYACIDYLNSEDWTYLIPEFQQVTQRLDQLRNENCQEVFPELRPLFI